MCVLYRDWLYRTKISKKFWRAKLGRGCWRYRGPIGRDDTREWPVWAQYRSWPYRRKFGSRKCVKKRVKLRILLVWDAPQNFWSDSKLILQDFVYVYIEFDSELKKIGSWEEQIILKEFAGKFGTYFFIFFGPMRIQNRRPHILYV